MDDAATDPGRRSTVLRIALVCLVFAVALAAAIGAFGWALLWLFDWLGELLNQSVE